MEELFISGIFLLRSLKNNDLSPYARLQRHLTTADSIMWREKEKCRVQVKMMMMISVVLTTLTQDDILTAVRGRTEQEGS